MTGRRLRRAVPLLLGLVSSPRLYADELRGESELQFRAERAAWDEHRRRLELDGNVRVASGRYRLTSARLLLRQAGAGTSLEGQGRLAFCPCAEPPVSLEFSGATLKNDELVLQNPTLRVGDLPIFWLPYLALRGAAQVGFLPPAIALRGRDGLLIGGGMHFPLSGSAECRDAVDIRLSGYLRGGVEIDTRVITDHSTARVRWDYLRQSLASMDAVGAASPARDTTAAYRADILRGPRALSGTVELEEAAKRYDQLSLGLFRSGDSSSLGIGWQSTAIRGGPLDSLGASGPTFRATLGRALGDFGVGHLSVAGATLSDGLHGAETRGAVRGEFRQELRLGAIGIGLDLRDELFGRATDGLASPSESGLLRFGGTLEARLPLIRQFGDDASPLLHVIEPLLSATGVRELGTLAISRGGLGDDQALGAALAGVRSELGSYEARSGASVEARAGYLSAARAALPGAALRAVVDTELVGMSADSVVAAGATSNSRMRVRARLGASRSLHVTSYFDSRHGDQASALRLLFRDAWDAPRVDWLNDVGTTLGGALHVPWARWLASSGAVDYDASNLLLLAVRGALSYRHECGCFAVDAWAGHRLGRAGVDAAITLDLLPR